MSDAVDLQAMQMVSLFSKAVPLPFHSELGAAEGRAYNKPLPNFTPHKIGRASWSEVD